MRQTKKLIDIHSEMRTEFDRIDAAMREEREQCKEDRRFTYISGAQWEGKYGEQFENKPKFEINKVKKAVDRIVNEYKNNRITVDFISATGEESDDLADTADALYRSDEQDSSATEAYDNSMYEACAGGIGAWRLRAEYEDEFDEENDYQRILIEPIYDADTSVFFDLDAKKYDKSDAKLCFVLSSYTRESMLEEWGQDVSSWPKSELARSDFDWVTADIVYVAEVYKVEEELEYLFIYKKLDGNEETYREEDFENDDELDAYLETIGTVFERERKIKTRRVRKYIMSGNAILEDSGFIAGKNIPIVPMYGTRLFIDNIERVSGETRTSKDMQRLMNMQFSKLGEISALSSIEKPIMVPEQFKGHEDTWGKDNIKNYAFLPINPVSDGNGGFTPLPPVGYTKVPSVPPALAALLQLTDVNMKELLGNVEQGEKVLPNLSGKALGLVQERLDIQTYNYMSNLAKSMVRSGNIWLSMAKELYVEKGRKMKGVVQDGSLTSIEISKPKFNEETGKNITTNELSDANLKIVSTVGPSSNSKRQAETRVILSMLQITQDPDTVQVLTSMMLMNMEGEGLSDARDYFRKKLLRMGAVKPTDEEKKELQEEQESQKPNPQDEYFTAAAEEAEANAAKARSNTVLTIAKSEGEQAKTDNTRADTMGKLSEIDVKERQQAFDAAQALGQLTIEQEPPNELTFEQ